MKTKSMKNNLLGYAYEEYPKGKVNISIFIFIARCVHIWNIFGFELSGTLVADKTPFRQMISTGIIHSYYLTS